MPSAVILAAALLVLLHMSSLPAHADPDGRANHQCRFDELQKKKHASGTGNSYTVTAQRRKAWNDAVQPAAADDEWEPIRILVSTEDLDDATKICSAVGQVVPDYEGGTNTCTEDDILTPEKRDILLTYLIPEAVKMHTERLKVRPLESIQVPKFDPSDYCGRFSIPEDHQTTGVTGYDYVLYLTAVPSEEGVVAWATECADDDSDGRPIVGITNICPVFIERSDYEMRTVTHEIMHALGFSSTYFEERNMSEIVSIRDVPSVPVITSNNVVQRTGNHFGCDTVPGMELETGGGAGTAGSHWKLRNAKDELMCGFAGPGRYTALSIAAMEDMGFYKGIYENAEFMNWGFQAGCDALHEKCLKDEVSQVPTMFCDKVDVPSVCTAVRDGLGKCRIVIYNRPLPPPFQYFADPTLGGTSSTADYCPLLGFTQVLSCDAGDRDNMSTSVPPSATSKCVDFAEPVGSVAGTCVEIRCSESAATYEVQLAGSTEFVPCSAGETIDAAKLSPSVFPEGTIITCPPFREVCPTVFNSLDLDVTFGLSAGGGDTARRGPHTWYAAAVVALAAAGALLL